MWESGLTFPVVFDSQAEIYTQADLSFSTLSHLDDIGLISFNNISPYNVTAIADKGALRYFGRTLVYERPPTRTTLNLGHAIFTNIGKELALLCGAEPVDGFFEYALKQWQAEGFKLLEVPQQFKSAMGVT
jgi:hypothetical protein